MTATSFSISFIKKEKNNGNAWNFYFTKPKGALFSESLGELAIRILLREYLGSAVAVIAATGWNGDRITLFPNSISWVSSWDSEKDAKQFKAALARLFSRRLNMRINEEVPWFNLPNTLLGDITVKQRKKLVLLRAIDK